MMLSLLIRVLLLIMLYDRIRHTTPCYPYKTSDCLSSCPQRSTLNRHYQQEAHAKSTHPTPRVHPHYHPTTLQRTPPPSPQLLLLIINSC